MSSRGDREESGMAGPDNGRALRNCGSASCSKPSWTGRWTGCWPGCGGRARDHRHRGRRRRVRPAPALRRGRAAGQRARPGRLAGPDRAARAAAGLPERLGQPAAPGRRPGPAARRGPAERDPAGRAAGRRPGGGHGGLPGRAAGRPGAALRRGRLAALPGGRLRAAVGAADRAVLVRPGRVRRGRSIPACGSAWNCTRGRACSTWRRSAGWPRSGPSIGANLDPSHFFWMGMDGHRVDRGARRAGSGTPRQGHRLPPDSLALNGLLDRRWPEPADGDAVDVRRPRPGSRPGLVDRPDAGAGRSHRPRWCRSSTRTRSCRPRPASPRRRGCCARRSTPPGTVPA